MDETKHTVSRASHRQNNTPAPPSAIMSSEEEEYSSGDNLGDAEAAPVYVFPALPCLQPTLSAFDRYGGATH